MESKVSIVSLLAIQTRFEDEQSLAFSRWYGHGFGVGSYRPC